MIIRRKQTANYTELPNIVLTDERISIEARWCLAYLLSKPDNWQVQTANIQNVGNVGKDKAHRLIRELIEAGWISRSAVRSDNGTFDGYEYVVTDSPSNIPSPCPEAPKPENPVPDNPKPVNKSLNKDGKRKSTEKVQNTQKDISSVLLFEEDFAEFWAAYPKRTPHANPKHTAHLLYIKTRNDLKVSHETLVNSAKDYALTMAGKDPQHVAQAQTWLRQRRWQDDYSLDGGTNRQEPSASDADLDKLAVNYSGRIGERNAAKKLLAAEMAKGTTLDALCEAAKKYSLYCKGPPYEDRRTTPAMLETWLRFKWREMDAYEFCKVGPDQIRTVRPKK